MHNITHPTIPAATCTLTPFTQLTELPLWWDNDRTREGEYPEEAFLYEYTGAGCDAPDIGPRSYVVRDKGKWWLYFDTDLTCEGDSMEAVAHELAEMDYTSLN